MKTIRFREDTAGDAFYNSLRKQVNEYLCVHQFDGYATRAVWVKGAIYLTMYVALYVYLLSGSFSFTTSMFIWAALGVMGILIGLNLSHDAAHGSLSSSRSLNQIIYALTFNALGANSYLWQLRHIASHHLFPNVDGCDADIDDNPIIRLSPYKPWHWYHRWQHLYAPFTYLFYTLVWVFIKDLIILRKKRLANLKDIRHAKKEVWFFVAAKLVYLGFMLALPIYCMNIVWWHVLTGFVVMHFTQSYTFVFGLSVSHFSMEPAFPKVDQEGYLAGSWAGHQVAASLDYNPTAYWANAIFGGFNAHVAHHLFPQISHVHYPVISVMIRQKALEFRIPYHYTTFSGAIMSHFRFLYKMGQQDT